MTPAVRAVIVACLAMGAGTGIGVYALLGWALSTQDDREVSW